MSTLAKPELPGLHLDTMPEALRDSVRLNWHITSWCNYSCNYCPVMIFHKRSENRVKQNHAFDHHSVDEWVELLERFPQKKFHLKITGGEPFLDRKNFRDLLIALTPQQRYDIGIDTNGYWDPKYFSGFDKSRIWLNVSYHAGETPFDKFYPRVMAMREEGFRVAMINFVMAPENMDMFDNAFTKLDKEGFFVSVSTMNPTGVYTSRDTREDWELDLLERYNTPLDVRYKISKPLTKGRPCFYPTLSYYMLYDGTIHVFCVGQPQNAFTDGIPELPKAAVDCPTDRCIGCTDMYRSLADEPRTEPLKMFTLVDYAKETTAWREKQKWKNAAKSLLPAFLKKPKLRHAVEPEPSQFVPLQSIAAAIPDEPVFGALDDGPVLEIRNRDRIALSGWAASRNSSTPLQEVRVMVGDREVGKVPFFHNRPEVASKYGRPELLRSGWRTMIFLPSFPRGDHQLTVHGISADGSERQFGSLCLRITE